MKITITADLGTVLDRICAESAWRKALYPDERLLTRDNSRMLSLLVGEGFGEWTRRMGAYVKAKNFNPNLDTGGILLTFSLRSLPEGFAESMQDALTAALAFYVLKTVYGEETTYFGTAWRKFRTQAVLLLAKSETV